MVSKRDFIKQNRDFIDSCIKSVCDNCKLNDSERENWVLNDEGLYNFAKSRGVYF